MKILLNALLWLIQKIIGCSKCTPIILFGLCLFVGCKSGNYLEGTNLTLGLYIPTTDGLVGLQICEYVNGVKVQINSNSVPFTVSRSHSSTNSYFWCVNTSENTETKIDVK